MDSASAAGSSKPSHDHLSTKR